MQFEFKWHVQVYKRSDWPLGAYLYQFHQHNKGLMTELMDGTDQSAANPAACSRNRLRYITVYRMLYTRI